MKKLSIVFLILINCIAYSSGQTKSSLDNTQNLSTEILGCWRLVDAYYEVKSNYPDIDSLSLEKLKLNMIQEIQTSYITKFNKNNVMQFYNLDGTEYGTDWYYEINKDSLSIEDINSLRLNTKSSSRISISNDTLYHEIGPLREVRKAIGDIIKRDHLDFNILEDIKIETAKRYTKFVRVKDCDQYKKEDE